MSKFDYAQSLTKGDIAKFLDEVPDNVKLDVVQLACDVVGLVNPAGDALSAIISLARGDLLGAAIGVVSIIPIGDVAKVAKLKIYQRYYKSLGILIDMAKRRPQMAKAIEGPMRQLRDALSEVQNLVGTGDTGPWSTMLNGMKRKVDDYFDHLRKIKSIASYGAAAIARKKGRAGGQFALQRGAKRVTSNVEEVVDMLEEATKNGRHAAANTDSKILLERMAMSDGWQVTSGVHRKGDPGSITKDPNLHITVKIGGDESYHVVVNSAGDLVRITDKTEQGLSGIAPWVGPGN